MYYLKITAYAEDLLDELNRMPDWPERVRAMQANWIGKSEGVRFGFPYDIGERRRVLQAFTTRADTIMGVDVLRRGGGASAGGLCGPGGSQLAAFIEECKRGPAIEAELATQEKKGMPTGLHVRHPISGKPIPVWVGNYVLMSYGDGAVMGVPAHDERDFEFAKKYDLPIKPVIEWQGPPVFHWRPGSRGIPIMAAACIPAPMTASSTKPRSTRSPRICRPRVSARSARPGDCATGESRGSAIGAARFPSSTAKVAAPCPCPTSNCRSFFPTDLVPDGSGNPLLKDERFLNVQCPTCGAAARRETDTMDTFVDSSWYFLRFACADNNQAMLDYRVQYWLPVDQYIGGIEHAILHLLYSRFWTRFLNEMGAVSFKEPFARLFTQGMVLNEVFFRKTDSGRLRILQSRPMSSRRTRAARAASRC